MEKQSFAKFWVIIIIAFLLVGIILLAWFITLRTTEEEVLESYNQQQFLLVEGTAIGVEGLFSDLSASLGSLGTLPEIQYFDEDAARQTLTRKFDELSTQGITDINVLDNRGTAQIFVVETEAEGTDYSWRSYFKEAQQTQLDDNTDQLIIELQTVGPGEQGLKIVVPVFQTIATTDQPTPSGEFAGVIVGSLALDTLVERHLVPFKPQGEGHIFLINDEYDIVWSSDDGTSQVNILGSRYRAFTDMTDRMAGWDRENSQGGFYTFEEPTGWNTSDLIAYTPVNFGQELMAIAVRTPGEIARQSSFSNFQRQQFVFVISILTIFIGVLVGGFVMRRETQRRFQLEESLKQSEMEQAIVSERNRLAGDLHDSVTQGLYGIVLHADAAKGQLSAGKNDQVTEYLDEIKDAGKEGLAEMRLLIFELRPPVLEAEGLTAALETRLYAVEKRAGLKTEIKNEIRDRLPLKIEDGLYRIAQEVLNNALKHAHAEHIWVHLNQVEQHVTLEIKDDGRGFDLASARKSGGMGLSTMEERAAIMDGNLTIESQPEKGTRIVVEVSI